MGFFDFLDDAIDAAIDLPGEIVEKSVEVFVRAPEVGIKMVEGAVNGLEKGIKTIEDATD